MYHDLNRIVLTGHVYEAPEMHLTSRGERYTTFLLSCSRRGKQRKQQPDLFFIRASGKRLAARCNALVPEMRILVEGRVQTRADDTHNGIVWFACQVCVRHLIVLQSPPDASGSVIFLPRSPSPAPSTMTATIEFFARP